MTIPWGNHLDLARWVALIEEDDLREATIATELLLDWIDPFIAEVERSRMLAWRPGVSL